MKKKGLLVSFEGLDKTGKSTQIYLLEEKLKEANYPVKSLSSLDSNKYIKDLILNIKSTIDNETELLLYMADRAMLTKKVLIELNEGKIVLVDRYIDSSVIYQGLMRKLDVDFIHKLNNFVTKGLTPDLTFILDVSYEEYKKRIRENKDLDRLEKDIINKYHLISNGYKQLLDLNERFVLIKEGNIKQVHNRIYKILKGVLLWM